MYLYRISILLLFVLPCSGLPAQIKIAGKIKHPVDTLVQLIVPPTRLGGESLKVSTPLSEENEFRFVIDVKISTPAVIGHGGASIPIFVVPDQSFSLEFTTDTEEIEQVQFMEPEGTNNTFFYEYLQLLKEKVPPVDSNRLARSTAREFRRLMDENRAAKEQLLEAHIQTAKTKLAPQLLEWIRNDIVYIYATELLRYPSFFQDLNEGTRNRNPSNSYYSFLERIRLNKPDAILQDSYQRFLEAFIIYKLEKPMSWALRTGGKRQYNLLDRFFLGPSLYYMQYLVFERSIQWLVEPTYMAEEYQSFLASKAPLALKQKLQQLRANPPKIYSMKSFSMVGGPMLWEVFQFHDSNRPDTSFFKGQPSLFYFHDRRLSRVDFIISYLKKLQRKLEIHREMNICLVDVNGDLEEWQNTYSRDGYSDHPITHLSMNYFDELFDPRMEQGIYPNIVVTNADGIIVEALDWKPPVKQIIEIINQIR